MTTDTSPITSALRSLKDGDLTVRLSETDPSTAEVAAEFNRLVEQIDETSREVSRVCNEVAMGRFGGQVEMPELAGVWKRIVADTNLASSTMTIQVRTVSKVLAARVAGDNMLISASADGEMRTVFELVNSVGKEPIAV